MTFSSSILLASWFRRTGESVKSISKEDAVRRRLFVHGEEGLMDAIAWEVEVGERAWVICKERSVSSLPSAAVSVTSN